MCQEDGKTISENWWIWKIREKRTTGVETIIGDVQQVRKEEIRSAMKKMKNGKAVRPNDIPVEVWKCIG